MWVVSPDNLFMTCKERYNLCMNRASLDCESWIVYRELAQPVSPNKSIS